MPKVQTNLLLAILASALSAVLAGLPQKGNATDPAPAVVETTRMPPPTLPKPSAVLAGLPQKGNATDPAPAVVETTRMPSPTLPKPSAVLASLPQKGNATDPAPAVVETTRMPPPTLPKPSAVLAGLPQKGNATDPAPAVVETTRMPPPTLPKALTPRDQKLYRRIFALQKQGRWPEADKKIARLEDDVLLGHVMAQRYLHPFAYRSRYHELKDWLSAYNDLPQAPRLHKLALQRRGRGESSPEHPVAKADGALLRAYGKRYSYHPRYPVSGSDLKKAKRLGHQLQWNIYNTRLSITEDTLQKTETKRLLGTRGVAHYTGKLAAAWYYYGRDGRAYRLAKKAASLSDSLPMVHWVAGLAAWRSNKIKEASQHFQVVAKAEKIDSWTRAAASYWAARCSLFLNKAEDVSNWLRQAASYPRTFYGVMARYSLGLPQAFDQQVFDQADKLSSTAIAPALERAIALLEVDRPEAAREEIAGLASRLPSEDFQNLSAMARLSEVMGFPDVAFRIGARMAALGEDQRPPAQDYDALDSALFPLPQSRPQNDWMLDRALVFALIRQESGFKNRARSPDGARGLLQIMPATARYIDQDKILGKKLTGLYQPEINLQLGQEYIAHLLDHPAVDNDLVKMVIAYNAGPGNLNKWFKKTTHHDDPLLFIESLPSKETRIFVERVLTNLWIYRLKLGQKTPSLNSLVAGLWPQYQAQEK